MYDSGGFLPSIFVFEYFTVSVNQKKTGTLLNIQNNIMKMNGLMNENVLKINLKKKEISHYLVCGYDFRQLINTND